MASQRSSRRNINLGRPVEAGRNESKRAAGGDAVSPETPTTSREATAHGQPLIYWLTAALCAGSLFVWLFGPTISNLATFWNTEPDYSHGFLVGPFAALMLWLRRETFPRTSAVPGWGGLALLAVGFGVAYIGERLFLTPLSGWALVVWVAGAVWLLAGRRIFVWSLPCIIFLLFMVPLPFRFEQTLSWYLQTVTTIISTAALQCLGQPAISEGHTIYLGTHVLEIEQACSGLRMFMGISAVAYAFIVLHQRPWWEKLALVLAVAPVAMASNAIRVVVTGLLMQRVSDKAAEQFSHDAAGWAMIVIAAVLFGLFVLYMRKLIVPVEVETGRQMLSQAAAR